MLRARIALPALLCDALHPRKRMLLSSNCYGYVTSLEETLHHIFYKKTYLPYKILTQDAGALIYCKTNVPQCLMLPESTNRVFGTTNNPWNATRCCGGSSGGEAALIALRGSLLGVGTDIAVCMYNLKFQRLDSRFTNNLGCVNCLLF